jgi:hypothetical protein
MSVVDWFLAAGGMILVGSVMVDVVATLVATAGSGTGWRPTRQFYRTTWAVWSRVARARWAPDRRERLLALYGPMSLLALLLLWLCGLVLGWAFVWFALRDSLEGDSGFGSHLYYSGIVLLTVGFGDITPTGFGPRLLTLAEAVTGLGTIALVISYLPALYGSFNRRETRLLTLDHPSGERIQPVSLIALHAPDGDLQRLYHFFAEWELWVAELLESHVSYPMLAFFRSQHAGQSWITALGVVVDAAAVTSATVEGADEREPFFLYRRGRRAINEIARRLCTTHAGGDALLDRSRFDVAYDRLRETGLRLRDRDESWERLVEYRGSYGSSLEGLIAYLAAPRGFWGHSAGDVLTEPQTQPVDGGSS